MAQKLRDRALFDLALDSKLRACDLVALRVSDFVCRRQDAREGHDPPAQDWSSDAVRGNGADPSRLTEWLEARRANDEEGIFPSRSNRGSHVTTRQSARLLKQWVTLIGLDPAAYGTHSMRRTKVSLLYKKTGNLLACQLLLGHTKLKSTVRYLGAELDDTLELSEALEL